MTDIQTAAAQLTDTKRLIRELKETLKAADPAYPAEEEKFLRARAVLDTQINAACAAQYLAAQEQLLASGMLYAAWHGFQLNLECCADPVRKTFLQADFEDLCHENSMRHLPMAHNARGTIDAFGAALSEDQSLLTEDITGYYAYLQTFGYKLAHYFGFRLADELGQYLIPGYICDRDLTARYERRLCEYLELCRLA